MVSLDKTMWIPMLLIYSLPVSDALWAKTLVRGVVGKNITIACHYEAWYRSHTKYWCHGWRRWCSIVVETNGQHGRRGRGSITDNPERGIFTVTVEDLHSGDTGWYSCGITTSGLDPMFNVQLQVSDEPVSVPVLGFLSPANVPDVRGSVTVSCKSERGSLPISYTWYENTLKISNNNNLDLRCRSFKQQSHQYYCKASNDNGTKSSEMVTVAVSNTGENCSYVVHFGNNERKVTERMMTTPFASTVKRSNESQNDTTRSTCTECYMIWNVGRWLYFALLGICSISVSLFTSIRKGPNEPKPHSLP
ncbi:CXADR-like membrane protein [Amblyraja radiata]|uniref:CXADR-like membrane protein n=1 Tax=Amblyraja radiata TaxID=386614 RepID=UPI0014030025|nr:CXADR-like membrane protein [Amblyraja radiata]